LFSRKAEKFGEGDSTLTVLGVPHLILRL